MLKCEWTTPEGVTTDSDTWFGLTMGTPTYGERKKKAIVLDVPGSSYPIVMDEFYGKAAYEEQDITYTFYGSASTMDALMNTVTRFEAHCMRFKGSITDDVMSAGENPHKLDSARCTGFDYVVSPFNLTVTYTVKFRGVYV